MIYCCEECGFLFSRVGEVRECPFCEADHIRPATAEEAKRLQALLMSTGSAVSLAEKMNYLKK